MIVTLRRERGSRAPGKCLSGLEVRMKGLQIPVEVSIVKTPPGSVVDAEWMDEALLTEHSPPLAHATFGLRKHHLPVA